MNLLYILPEYVNNAGGGIITFYRNFLPLLAAQGHRVKVIVGSGVVAERAVSAVNIDGVMVETLEWTRLEKFYQRFAHYSALPGLRRFLAGAWAMWEQANKGEGFDLVEVSDWGLLYLPWVIEKCPPIVVQMHGSMGQIDLHDPVRGEEVQGNLIRMIERQGVALATSVQAYSAANAQFWSSQISKPVKHILPAWKPLQSNREQGTRSERGLVVGRVQRWKGPAILCSALSIMGKRAPGIDWVGRDTVFGNKGLRTSDYLEKNWPEIWGSLVDHKPQQSFEQTARFQAEAKFILVPSLWDTFNFTCVEAMGAGTPVICSNGAGAHELIDDGVNGFIFENGNAESLVNAIERMLSLSDAGRRDLVEAAQETVLRELDPVAICRQREQVYSSLSHKGRQTALDNSDWLREACSPAKPARDRLDFLDQLPLKALVAYSFRRTFEKIWR